MQEVVRGSWLSCRCMLNNGWPLFVHCCNDDLLSRLPVAAGDSEHGLSEVLQYGAVLVHAVCPAGRTHCAAGRTGACPPFPLRALPVEVPLTGQPASRDGQPGVPNGQPWFLLRLPARQRGRLQWRWRDGANTILLPGVWLPW